MAQSVQEVPTELFVREEIPELEELLETEGYVDGSFAGRQQQILLNAAHDSYRPPPDPARPGVERTFWAAADLPVMQDRKTILAPDFLLALDQTDPDDRLEKAYELSHRPAPDLMVDHVSNRRGGELERKKRTYAEWGCRHYVVYDPELQISRKALHVFELVNGRYVAMSAPYYFPSLGVGVTLWKGARASDTFLRLCDRSGAALRTGAEKCELLAAIADQAEALADEAVAIADQAEALADEAEARARAERAGARAERARARAERAERIAEALRDTLRKLGLQTDDSR
jgi:hypothetical protein